MVLVQQLEWTKTTLSLIYHFIVKQVNGDTEERLVMGRTKVSLKGLPSKDSQGQKEELFNKPPPYPGDPKPLTTQLVSE